MLARLAEAISVVPVNPAAATTVVVRLRLDIITRFLLSPELLITPDYSNWGNQSKFQVIIQRAEHCIRYTNCDF